MVGPTSFPASSSLSSIQGSTAMATDNPYQDPNGPMPSPGGPTGEKPKNYLIESILITLCCCPVLGIVSIVFAAQVDSKWNQGDQAGAVESAGKAKQFAIYGLVAGIVINLLLGGVQVLAIMGAAAQ